MKQFFLLAILGFALFAGIVAYIQDSMVSAPSSAGAAAISTAPFVSRATLYGTLTYYPDNVGTPVPYIVYRGSYGAEAKALVFGSSSVCVTLFGTYPCSLIRTALRTYYADNFVQAVGSVRYENLYVHRLQVATTTVH
jgi:hypothetical protein